MANKLYEEENIQNIANAIRNKNGLTTTYKVSEMPQAILDIPSGANIIPLEITENGTYTAPAGIDGYSPITVNVSGQQEHEVFGYPLQLNGIKTASTLTGYKFYGNSKQGMLPDGYMQLEYIESTGTQYIDTGIIPTRTMNYEFYGAVSSAITTNSAFFGSRNENIGGTGLYFWCNNANSIAVDFFGTSSGNRWTISNNIQLNSIYSININNKDVTIYKDGTSIGNKLFTTTGSTNYTLYIGALNNGGQALPTNANIKIYKFKIWDNNILVQNLVPAKRNSDSVLGMYDLVSQTFLTNKGTGTFIAGTEILPTPTNPIEIESVGDISKNLLKMSYFTSNQTFLSTTDGSLLNITPNNQRGEFHNLPIKSGKTYTVSCDNSHSIGRIGYCDKDGIVTNNTYDTWNTKRTLEAPLNATTMWCIVGNTNGTGNFTTAGLKLQVEEGDTATSYEQHYDGYKIPVKVNDTISIDIYLSEPLRRIGNYADYVDYEGQKVVRNVGSKLFNGTENYWTIASGNYFSVLKTSIGTNSTILPSSSQNAISSRFANGRGRVDLKFSVGGSYINFVYDALNYDISTWTNWLSNNNVEFVYPIATPTEETITLPQINYNTGDNIITTDTTIKPSDAYAKYLD